MGVKHKKTRKEKIIADYRHNVYTLKNKSSTSFSRDDTSNHEVFEKVLDKNLTISAPTVASVTVNTNSYSYVINDVVKTGALTSFIIAGELILFFLLKNHILKIPGIVY